MVPDFSASYAESQRNLLAFLQIDLELCFTFADLVNTELRIGDREAALRVNAKAQLAYDTIAHLSLRVDDDAAKNEVHQRLTELRARLDGLQHDLQPAI